MRAALLLCVRVMFKLSDRNSTKTCPTCGQVIGPEVPHLPPTKQRIYEIIRKHPGISAEQLRDAVWWDRPDGGPESRHALYVHVAQLNARLKPFGIVVRAPRGGTEGYRIQKCDMEQAS